VGRRRSERCVVEDEAAQEQGAAAVPLTAEAHQCRKDRRGKMLDEQRRAGDEALQARRGAVGIESATAQELT